LTEKVLNGKAIAENEIPTCKMDNGQDFEFSIGVMQYGLACYDLYLLTKAQKHLKKLYLCAEWAIDHQEENGAWSTFAHLYPQKPYSAMAQGEGVSMLIRAYRESKNERYLAAAKKAVYFMLVPVDEGGVCISNQDELIFKEYTERPIVLNGWIFAIWGLLDYVKQTGDETIRASYEKTLSTLEKYLPYYDLGYWSRYDYSMRIAAPFYHKLHIDQLTVMYALTGHQIFDQYRQKFASYQQHFIYRNRAFIIKAVQKLMGK